jgi:hypothetical protein
MTKSDEYRARLRSLKSWDAYLLQESGLPGPRGNLELAQVVADEGDLALFRRYLTYTYGLAPVNSPYEFLAFCGVVGLGRVIVESGGINANRELVEDLRGCASDPRWRLREGVAMALQRIGEVDMEGEYPWSRGLRLRHCANRACWASLSKSARFCRSWITLPPRSQTSATDEARISWPCARAWATVGAWPWQPCRTKAKRPWSAGWRTRIRISVGSCART